MQSISKAIEQLRQGKIVIMIDDEDRENEGDFVVAAEFVSAESINFLAKYGRGLICLAMDGALIDKLQLPMMTSHNRTPLQTAFTVSIEARSGVTTGISAADRAHTIRTAVSELVKAEDIVSPGHVFPLRAVSGGVLLRTGHTEGSVDLAKLANLRPAAVICEIMNDDGSMARVPDLEIIAQEHNLPIVSIKDLVSYRLERDSLIEPINTTPELFSWRHMGKSVDFQLRKFRSLVDGIEHFSLSRGSIGDTPLVRVHAEAGLEDVFGDLVTNALLELIQSPEGGHFVFIRKPESHSQSISEFFTQLQQDESLAERPKNKGDSPQLRQNYLRQIGIGAQILRELGVQRMRILTRSPKKLVSLDGYGLEIIEKIPFGVAATSPDAMVRNEKELSSYAISDSSQPIQ